MTAAHRVGTVAQVLGRTMLGRRAGTVAYSAIATVAAKRLVAMPNVTSAYVMGPLARGHLVEPGNSDIDLVVACDFDSEESELRTLDGLIAWQAQVSVLGGLLYNLDCFDMREVPFVRAFGGAWEMRLDAEGKCLAGRSLWSRPAPREKGSRQREQLGYALRRWINTGARLFDPRVDPAEALWDAQRIVVDVVALWAGLHAAADGAPLLAALGHRPDLPATTEVRSRGIEQCGVAEIRPLLLPAALELLEAFADEVTANFGGELPTAGTDATFTPHPALPELGKALLGDPIESVALLARGTSAGGHIPIALARDGTCARAVVDAFAERLSRARPVLDALATTCRRPVLFTQRLWRALSLVEPAPFLAAAAARPLWQAGRALVPPPAPGADALAGLLDSGVVQSFGLCRGVELRPNKAATQRRDALRDRFGLLPRLDRAIDEGRFSVGVGDDRRDIAVLSRGDRVRIVRDFSERHRKRLAPLLAKRLAGTE